MEQIPNCFYRVSAKALVLDENNTKFLLMKEDNNLRDFPGGGLDFGENTKEGIIREFQEETGLETTYVAQHPSYFITREKPEKNIRMAHVFYETKLKNLNFTPSDECQEMKFFTKEEAEKLETYSNVKEFIKQFNSENHKK